MLPWTPNRSRCLTGYGVFVFAVLIGVVFFTVAPLHAQTEAVPDPSAPPPVETAPTTPAPATPAATTPTESAVTVPSDSNLSSYGTGTSAAAGPTPTTGPGAGPTSTLGDRINSAPLATRLPFRITAALTEIYDNNIFAGQHKESDFITRLGISGELQLGALAVVNGKYEKNADGTYVLNVDGDYLDILYAPTLRLYARHSAEDGVDHNADVLFAHRWTKLTLSLEQIYTTTQSTNAAIGGLVTDQIFNTIAKANFAYSDKLDLVATAKQEFTSYDNPDYADSRQWTADLYALYHLDDKLSVGVGPRLGYLLLSDSPDETFQQLLVRGIYIPSEKLNLQGAVGGEYREYPSSSRSDEVNPIFEFSGYYFPEPSTRIAVDAARRFRPSYNFAGQDYIATNVDLSINQRFFQFYYAGLAAGYENDDYRVVAGETSGPTREDNFFYVEPNVRWQPTGWLALSAFDRYEEDSSNFDFFSYDINQVGVSVSATY